MKVPGLETLPTELERLHPPKREGLRWDGVLSAVVILELMAVARRLDLFTYRLDTAYLAFSLFLHALYFHAPGPSPPPGPSRPPVWSPALARDPWGLRRDSRGWLVVGLTLLAPTPPVGRGPPHPH